MIPVLLDMAVQKDSIINCDEIWCKVRVKGKYRKNSISFGSYKMAAASAVYHTLIATCRKTSVSIKELKIDEDLLRLNNLSQYFKKVFSEIIHGNENWPQLLPMTIGIPVNKI
ncbi:MAG: hypothetical protein K1W02_08135 [Muribaculaceae bacterium]